MRKLFIAIAMISIALTSCSKGSTPKKSVASLPTYADSLAYVIGLNVADNLMAMDSTININAVCRAIAEYASDKPLMTLEESKLYYLRYVTHIEPERKRGYEAQYLTDLAKSNRQYTLSRSGIAYDITIIGDESLTPRSNNDLLTIQYTMKRIDGSEIYSSQQDEDVVKYTLRDLNAGMQETLKMIGQGGKINAWIPSRLAYGEVGDAELGVEPFETILYEIELVEMARNGAIQTGASAASVR